MDIETISNLVASGMIVPTVQGFKKLLPWLTQLPGVVFVLALGLALGLNWLAGFAHGGVAWLSPEHLQTSTWMALLAIGIKTGWKTVNKTRRLPGEKR